MLQVLLAGFGEVALRGIRAILSSPELVIDECAIECVMSAVAARTPDVVVIEAGCATSRALNGSPPPALQ